MGISMAKDTSSLELRTLEKSSKKVFMAYANAEEMKMSPAAPMERRKESMRVQKSSK